MVQQKGVNHGSDNLLYLSFPFHQLRPFSLLLPDPHSSHTIIDRLASSDRLILQPLYPNLSLDSGNPITLYLFVQMDFHSLILTESEQDVTDTSSNGSESHLIIFKVVIH